MRKVLFCFPILLMSVFVFGQTTLLNDSGASYTGIDTEVEDVYTLDISNCTSISLSLDYEFSQPWEGSGNMETVEDCATSGAGPPCPPSGIACIGDPTMPQLDRCCGCWDFMWIRVILDDVEQTSCTKLIGGTGTTDADQFGDFSCDICTDGALSLDFSITNQNWAGAETNTFSNVVVVCYEAIPDIIEPLTACEDEVISLDGTVNASKINSTVWSTDGTGSFSNTSSLSTILSGASDGDEIFLTSSDVNGCNGEDSFILDLDPAPPITPITIEGCTAALEDYDLTQHDFTVGGGETVTWWDDQPSGGFATEIFSNADLTGMTSIWVLVDDGTCTAELEITITETFGPTITDPDIEDCTSNLMNYDLTDEDGNVGTGTVTWYQGEPGNGGVIINPATDVDISGGFDLWVELEDINGCTSIIEVTITENPDPTITDPDLEICINELTDYDLTQHDATVEGGNGFTVEWYDGDPNNGGSLLSPATNADLTGVDLWVKVIDPSSNCMSVLDIMVVEVALPTITDPMIQACDNELMMYDLTSEDINVGTGTVTWWDGQPSTGTATDLTPYDPVDIGSTSTIDLWAQLEDATTGCLNEIQVTVIIDPAPVPNTFTITECTDEAMNYDLDAEAGNVGTGNVTWFDGQPSMGGVQLGPPADNVDLTSIANGLWVVLEDPATGCTAEIEITLDLVDSPTGCYQNSGDIYICENACGPILEFILEGGSGEYDIQIELSAAGLGPFTFDLPAVVDEQKFEICASDAITFPESDGGSVTFPTTIIGFPIPDCLDITIELISIVDANTGCIGTIDPGCLDIDLIYKRAPDAELVPYDICAGPDAITYDLSMDDNDVIGTGNGTSVMWYNGQPSNGGVNIGPIYDLTDPGLDLWALVTNDAGCTEEIQMTIDLIAVPEVDVSGGGTLCIGDCTSTSSTADDFSFTVTGGVGPYNVFFWVGDDSPANSFVYQNIPQGTSSFQICFEEDCSTCPDIDNSVSPPSITFDAGMIIGNTVEVTSITDLGTNCEGIIIGEPSAKYDVLPSAEFDLGEDQELCAEPGGCATFDLTSLEADIIITPGATVNWWTGANCDNFISNPSAFNICFDEMICYTVVHPSGCESGAEMLSLMIEPSPLFDPIADINFCGDEYQFNFPTGTDLSGDEMYFTEVSGGGTSYSAGDFIDWDDTPITLYLYDPTAPNCGDEVSFTLNVVPDPNLVSPNQDLTGCGSVELPMIFLQDNINLPFYYSGPGGTGMQFAAGDLISTSMTLYVFVDNGFGCTDEIQIEITILDQITFEIPIPASNCGFVKLPEIGNATPNTVYSTDQDNLSDPYYLPCDTIFFTDGITELYVLDIIIGEGCITNNGEAVPLNINASPIVNDIPDLNVCDSFVLEPITGIDLTTNESYFSATGGTGVAFAVGDVITSTSTLFIYDASGTCDTEESFTINVETQANPGIGDTIRLCQGFVQDWDLESYINGSPASGGAWNDNTGNGLDLADINNVDLSGLGLGSNFQIEYGFTGGVCPDTFSTIVIQVIDPPFVNVDPMLTLCNNSAADDLDISTLLSTFSSGLDYNGTWMELPNPQLFGINNTNTMLPIDGTTPGLYQYVYSISSGTIAACGSAMDTVKIEIVEQIDAGDDNEDLATCAGEDVDFSMFVNDLAGGTYVDIGGTGQLTGSVLNTTGLTNDTYTFQYIVEAMGTCLADTANLAVTVTDNLTAGSDTLVTVCQGIDVNLFSILASDADSGGSFYDTSGNPISSTYTAIGDIIIDYQVGTPGSACGSDDSQLTIEVVSPPICAVSAPSTPVCDQDCIEYTLELSGSNEYLFDLTFINDNGVQAIESFTTSGNYVLTICNYDNTIQFQNDTLFIDNTVNDNWSINLSNLTNQTSCTANVLGCDFDFVSNGELRRDVVETLCPGSFIFVNGSLYDETNSFGTETITVAGQCDSTIYVDLTYYTPAVDNLTLFACSGNTVTVGGQVFDETSPDLTGTIVLDGMATTGCDSTINYVITFQSSIPLLIDDTYCPGSVVEINGEFYDEGNADGNFTIGGVNGDCDTMVTIALQFYDIIPGDFTPSFCIGDSPIQIGGMFFDENTPSGPVTLPGMSANGCDSLVNVVLDINTEVMEPYGVSEICPGDIIDINGVIFDQDNLDGEVVVGTAANGCDSVVIVNLSLITGSLGQIVDEVCDGASITILGVEFSADNLQQQIMIPGGSSTGCDSMVNVTVDLLFPQSFMYTDTICPGQSFVINGITYDVDNPTGEETLAGMASNGCDSIVMIDLTFELDYSYEAFAPCPGSELGTVTIYSAVGATLPLVLTFDDGSMETITDFPYTFDALEGASMASILDVNGCTFDLMAVVPPAADTDFFISSSDNGVNVYELEIISDIMDFDTIIWSPATGSCINCTTNTYSISEETTVTLTATYADGQCILTDDITLLYDEIETSFIPNVISHNDSGENGSFFVQTDNDNDMVRNMRIYDRWGNLIFEADEIPVNRPDVGWRGNFNDEPVIQGVYIYVLDIEFEGGEVHNKAGDITIVR